MTQTIDLRNKQQAVPAPAPLPPAPEPEPVEETEELAPVPETETGVMYWQARLERALSTEQAWYAGLGLFAGAAIALFFAHNFLFGITLALAGTVLLLKAHFPADHSHVRVDKHGVTINQEHYPYHEIHSFWLDYHPPHFKELSLRFRKLHQTPLRIPLGDINPLEIRAHMVQFIPEKEHERSLVDQVVRMLGF